MGRRGFQFGDQRGLGGIEPGDLAADGGGLLVAAFGLPGSAGGELGGELGGAALFSASGKPLAIFSMP
jgi:hypothetical protein